MHSIKIIFLSVVVAFIGLQAAGQQKATATTLRYSSINSIGLLEGQSGSAFQAQTIHGIKSGSWYFGAGIGLDFYNYRTIPLFADIRKEFGKKDSKLFVYTDAGVNFYWARQNDVKEYFTNQQFKNGFYGDAGVGYSIKLNMNAAFVLSVGYSYKAIREHGDYLWNPPAGSDRTATTTHQFNRWAIKAGFSF